MTAAVASTVMFVNVFGPWWLQASMTLVGFTLIAWQAVKS